MVIPADASSLMRSNSETSNSVLSTSGLAAKRVSEGELRGNDLGGHLA